MAEQRGIKEIKDYFSLAIEFKTAIELAKANDGKVDINDYIHFLSPMTKLPAAITGTSEIPAEFDDLSDAEIEELKAEFGKMVDDPRYQRLFKGLVIVGSSLEDILTGDLPVEQV